MAEPEHLELLVRLVEDPACPARRWLLGSLYCTVGHTDHTDPRIAAAIGEAERSTEPWLTTWARRSRHVLENPENFDRDDWCGSDTLATRPVD
ncbi:hypothetical protein EV646_1037 [Kribbella antiqua]|uniref:HEAT repeat protein n=1 Tax=Kribbella antiqua TaxID=2512217 RepID=A0A4V2S4Q2_9ACTN|nr:hypothetical protein [Kribbella antiqua]TCO49030.1 hypothetical protein EV646_1037 [Kribbella antiqua]